MVVKTLEKLTDEVSEKPAVVETRPLLKNQLEERGTPIVIEAPRSLSSESADFVLEAFKHAGDTDFLISFEGLTEKPSATWQEAKDVAALRLVEEVVQRKALHEEKENARLAPGALKAVQRERELGIHTGYTESNPLMQISETYAGFEDFLTTKTALTIMETTLDTLTSIVEKADGSGNIPEQFQSRMRMLITKATTDKLLRLTGNRDSGIELPWESDETSRALFEQAEHMAQTIYEVSKDTHSAQLVEKQTAVLRKMEGDLMLKMLAAYNEIPVRDEKGEAPDASHEFSQRASNICRTLAGQTFNKELQRTANEMFPDDLTRTPAIANHEQFLFAPGREVLDLSNQGVSIDVFRNNVLYIIYENSKRIRPLEDNKQLRGGIVEFVDKELVRGSELARNVEFGIDVFQRITEGYNAMLAVDTGSREPLLSTDIPIRVMEAIVAKQTALMYDKSFAMAVDAPINAQIEEGMSYRQARLNPSESLAEGLNNLTQILDEGMRDAKLWGDPNYRHSVTSAYLYAAKALQTHDAWADVTSKRLKGRSPVAVPRLTKGGRN